MDAKGSGMYRINIPTCSALHARAIVFTRLERWHIIMRLTRRRGKRRKTFKTERGGEVERVRRPLKSIAAAPAGISHGKLKGQSMQGKKRTAQEVQNLKQSMLEQLRKTFGVVSYAAKAAGINREQHYIWLKEDPAYKSKTEEIPELLIDFAENALFAAIEKGSIPAIIFTLKTKGRARGWVEKQVEAPTEQKESIFAKIEKLKAS